MPVGPDRQERHSALTHPLAPQLAHKSTSRRLVGEVAVVSRNTEDCSDP